MTEPLAALKAAEDDPLAFWGLAHPRCPHCGVVCDIQDWFHLYEEGEHEVTCPACTLPFTVTTEVSYSFSTDHQENTHG